MRRTGSVTSPYFGLTKAEEGFRKMKACGFDCADYQNFVNTDTELFSVSDGKFEEWVTEHRLAAESAGIEIYQTHGPWRSPKDATEEDRAERLEKMKKSLWGTSLLNCKYMAIHPIMPYGTWQNPEPERFYELNLEFFGRLLPTAKSCGVTLCLENMPFPHLTLSGTEQIYGFIKDIDSENFAMCLDTGHCAVMKESPADAIRKIGNTIKILHIHDNDGSGDQHLYPLHGTIDWEDFKAALKSLDEKVAVSLETSANWKLRGKSDIYEHFQGGLVKIAKYLAE